MFLVVNDPEEQEFFLKNQNFKRFWDVIGACMEFSLVFGFFRLANNQN
jgi:hypothetical protein